MHACMHAWQTLRDCACSRVSFGLKIPFLLLSADFLRRQLLVAQWLPCGQLADLSLLCIEAVLCG